MQWSHCALTVLVIAVWGFNFVVIKVGLEEIPPLLLVFSRFFLISIPAVFFVKRPAVPFKMIVGYGLIMFALQFSLLFLGMYAGVSPGLASLLMQTQVFFTVLLAMMFFGETWHLWQIIGGLVAFSGIALVSMNLGGGLTLLGFFLVIASAVCWSVGNVISKKIGKVNTVPLVIWSSLVAWPPLLMISLMVEGGDKVLYALQHLTWVSGGAVLYITYLSTLFGYGVWSWLLHHHPLGAVAPFTLLVPVFGILSSVLVLGEPLQSWKIVAALLVIIGLCINMLGPRVFIGKIKK
ncbi:MAG: EamA family transporter [Simkania sp.]|nr:EamA family transporter [Simkania sp.]